MPTVNLYPITVVQSIGPLTNQNNILGWDTGLTSTYSGSLPMNTSVGFTLEFAFKDFIPAGSTINTVRLKTRASCAQANMTFYNSSIKAHDQPDYVYLKSAASSIPSTTTTFNITFDAVTTYIPSVELLTGQNPVVEVSFVNLNAFAITVSSLVVQVIWLEVDFTNPANIGAANIGFAVNQIDESTNLWTNNFQGLNLDSQYATRTVTVGGGIVAGFHYLNDATTAFPSNAIVTGVMIDVFAHASNIQATPYVYPKHWGLSDGMHTSNLTTGSKLHRFGSMTNTLGRTRQNIQGTMQDWEQNSYIRFSQSQSVTSTISLDHMQAIVYYTLPPSGNSLFFGENF